VAFSHLHSGEVLALLLDGSHLGLGTFRLASFHIENHRGLLVTLRLFLEFLGGGGSSYNEGRLDLVRLVASNTTNCNCAAFITQREPAQLRKNVVLITSDGELALNANSHFSE